MPGVDLALYQAVAPFLSGSGGRGLRRWVERTPCCGGAQLGRLTDGRWRCGDCAGWFSASHSGGRLALARAREPVGVDIQLDCHRPAALRWLARVSGLETATIAHWAAAEAILKAVGQAGSRPQPGWATLPETLVLGERSILRLASPAGAQVELLMLTVGQAALAVARLIDDPPAGHKRPFGQG